METIVETKRSPPVAEETNWKPAAEAEGNEERIIPVLVSNQMVHTTIFSISPACMVRPASLLTCPLEVFIASAFSVHVVCTSQKRSKGRRQPEACGELSCPSGWESIGTMPPCL